MALFRLRSEVKIFNPNIPYDLNGDDVFFGTGFLLEHEGEKIVLTAHHVVANAIRITGVTHEAPETITFDIMGMQPELDVAILKARTNDHLISSLSAFRGASGDPVKAKSVVTVLGFANADRHVHTTTGTVSGRTNWPLNRIQTDAAVNSGNSGGPVVNKSGAVVGLVTSGMDMQSTNHFVSLEDLHHAIDRIRHMKGTGASPFPDLGLYINAILVPVDSSALLNASPPGAFVAAAYDHTGLREGDVITRVEIGSDMRALDALMMIHVPEVWNHRMDFRVWLDRLPSRTRSGTWNMEVFRDGKPVRVSVAVGPRLFPGRELVPDCEPVAYVLFHGLVVQMRNIHHSKDNCERHEHASVRLKSYPIVTHVLPGSPFQFQDSIRLKNKRISHLVTSLGQVSVTDLYQLSERAAAIPTGSDVVLVLGTGERVGAGAADLDRFGAEPARVKRIMLPHWNEVDFDVFPGDGSPGPQAILRTVPNKDSDPEQRAILLSGTRVSRAHPQPSRTLETAISLAIGALVAKWLCNR